MTDKGINKGLVQSFDTSNINTQNVFFGFRKMFRDYLNKLGVGFYDSCCPQANNKLSVYVDKVTKQLMYVDTNGVAKRVLPEVAPVAGGGGPTI